MRTGFGKLLSKTAVDSELYYVFYIAQTVGKIHTTIKHMPSILNDGYIAYVLATYIPCVSSTRSRRRQT